MLASACWDGTLVTSTIRLYKVGASNSATLTCAWFAIGVSVVWVALFWNHTKLHAFMMARLLVIPVLCGSVAAVAAFSKAKLMWRSPGGNACKSISDIAPVAHRRTGLL